MRTTVLAMVAAMAATTASAMDTGITGLALNTEVVLEHKVDAETTTFVATPELEYSPFFLGGVALTAGIELNIWDDANKFTLDDEFDVKPEILLGATYTPVAMQNLDLEAATSYNFETEDRGEVTFTATFNF
jgi:hypothetical protein